MLAGDVCARARPEPARRELTEAERETFWRQGFLTVPGLFTEHELQELDDHSAALADGSIRMEQPSGAGIDEHEFPEELDGPDSRASLEENRFFRYIQQHRNIPLHEHYLLHPRVLDVLEQLIGPDIMAMQSMLFLKPPQQPGPVKFTEASTAKDHEFESELSRWVVCCSYIKSSGYGSDSGYMDSGAEVVNVVLVVDAAGQVLETAKDQEKGHPG